MENIIDFKAGADRPSEAALGATTELNIDADDIEALHAEAFRDLENRLKDCVTMATIAFDLSIAKIDDRPVARQRELDFAVAHTWELLSKLERDYYASYHNKKSGGVHTSNI
jgi:hypothetical protein